MLLIMIGCFASHHVDPETGDEYHNFGGAYGDIPVSSITTSTRSGNRYTTETVTFWNQYGGYGYEPMPTLVSYDPALAQAAAYSAAFRQQWMQQNGMSPPAVGGSPGSPVSEGGNVSASQVLVDPSATCPKVGMPRTQAEMDACQNDGMGQIMVRLPVSK